jgi:pimeloyl-ACP methyl ester carboxylesterase
VRYVRGPDGWIAYQVWGAGDVDLLWPSSWGTSVDNIWDHPARIRFLGFHGSLGRVLHFDPRGQGPSDSLPSLEGDLLGAWVDDARVVLDALVPGRVVVVAELLAAHVALRLAAREARPRRTRWAVEHVVWPATGG